MCFFRCGLHVAWAYSRVTLYTAGHLHTAVPHCSHSRAPIVHTAVPRENNEHACVYLCCRAVCKLKLPGCVEGHPWYSKWGRTRAVNNSLKLSLSIYSKDLRMSPAIEFGLFIFADICLLKLRSCSIFTPRSTSASDRLSGNPFISYSWS